ncbi:type II toxin-antitoxin system HicB family antitoxin [Pandoraea sp. PE-S2R-1]|uniref:type II toxin-antitoxin system HicB family antitoxin n=1 Tax=Pandoraea sp. PE-S2R-1 TaxID=1986994 RepID=UPI001131B15A|nr:type II toxin-antitoxin system HicB family antitoxin [Pandoraea sp. PE-S2R-1]
MSTYPFTLERDTNGTLLVRFPDVPEAITVADDEADAHVQAREALEAALVLYAKRPLPEPSCPNAGQATVTLVVVT